MIGENDSAACQVDVVMPAYNELPEALEATLFACLRQTYGVNNIFLVDDGSPVPVALPASVQSSPQVTLMRLPQNLGISQARNAGIARSNALFVACINVDVLPNVDWVSTCLQYLVAHPAVGACGTLVVPQNQGRLLTRWRMRFQEPGWPAESGPIDFVHGHAVFFRREAIDSIQGYDAQRLEHKYHLEDSDICQRMRKKGWESHFVAQSRCISIQKDSLRLLATKNLRDSGWYGPSSSSLLPLYFNLSKWGAIRATRNISKARFHFLPVDFAVWAYSLFFATKRTLQSKQHSVSK
jgi:GT2 family glycosyltransferase